MVKHGRTNVTFSKNFVAYVSADLLDRIGSHWEQFTLARDRLLTVGDDLWSCFGNPVINELHAALANISSEKMRRAGDQSNVRV